MSRLDRHEHDRALELAASAIDYGLARDQAAALSAHLATCPACTRSAAAMRGDAIALQSRSMLLPSRRVDDAVAAAITGRPRRSANTLLLLATALLLVAVLGVAAVAGSILLRTWRGNPMLNEAPVPVIGADMPAAEVVATSIRVHADPPPFALTTSMGPADEFRANWYTACGNLDDPADRAQVHWRYLFDGSGFRQECRYGGSDGLAYMGGFEVLTPDGHGTWDAASWRPISGPFLGRPAGAPPATLLWLNWVNVGAAADASAGRTVTCDAWALGPLEDVAGRSARVVACGSDRYWVDLASGLLVKREQAGTVLASAVDLTVGSAPDPAQFKMLDASFTTSVEPGRKPAVIELPRFGGGTWSSDALLGRPSAVLMLDCTTLDCPLLDEFVEAVTARSRELQGVAISGTPSPRAMAAAEAAGVPVMLDDQGGWPRWDNSAGLVLFDADGTVKATISPRTAESLAAVLDAFVAGQPIPVPPAWDGVFNVGDPVEPLFGSVIRDGQLTTDVFDLGALRGRPVVVTVALQPDPMQGPDNEQANAQAVAAIAAAHGELGDKATFVLVAGNRLSGDALATWARLLGGAGTTDRDITVVMPSEYSTERWFPLVLGEEVQALPQPAMLVVEPDGDVARIFAGGLPTQAELRAAIAEAASAP